MKAKSPIILNQEGQVKLEAVDKKLCDSCHNSRRTKVYCFTDNTINWTRTWCKRCFKEWKGGGCKALLAAVKVTLEGVKTPWWKRIWRKFKAKEKNNEKSKSATHV